ncbi:hypothetical protein [Haloarcula marismortui]|jgi:hypothetical protein|uniref:Uncharacterized protein n=1 Tax=Haloarcula marismortui ATCC 33799 TaxID=662475 RepID=M0KYM0_9EURY|nr:hypothetical protein [Haloarcula californiae]EMA24880.1 hypothetical protein C435_03268 [Haloarcula californiae ATCC 33799]
MCEIDFIATFGTGIEHEFDRPLEELDHEALADAAEEYFDGLSESELRSLYRDSQIEVDDPIA